MQVYNDAKRLVSINDSSIALIISFTSKGFIGIMFKRIDKKTKRLFKCIRLINLCI